MAPQARGFLGSLSKEGSGVAYLFSNYWEFGPPVKGAAIAVWDLLASIGPGP